MPCFLTSCLCPLPMRSCCCCLYLGLSRRGLPGRSLAGLPGNLPSICWLQVIKPLLGCFQHVSVVLWELQGAKSLAAARCSDLCFFLQHDTPWLRGWGEPKGFGGSRTSQHHCGSCFAPAQACSCWGHTLPVAPHLLLH